MKSEEPERGASTSGYIAPTSSTMHFLGMESRIIELCLASLCYMAVRIQPFSARMQPINEAEHETSTG